jgi:hypothetical protein
MNVGLQLIRYIAAFLLVVEGLHTTVTTPALIGIPLLMGGLALLMANQPVVDRFVIRLETWRHSRCHSPRTPHW